MKTKNQNKTSNAVAVPTTRNLLEVRADKTKPSIIFKHDTGKQIYGSIIEEIERLYEKTFEHEIMCDALRNHHVSTKGEEETRDKLYKEHSAVVKSYKKRASDLNKGWKLFCKIVNTKTGSIDKCPACLETDLSMILIYRGKISICHGDVRRYAILGRICEWKGRKVR